LQIALLIWCLVPFFQLSKTVPAEQADMYFANVLFTNTKFEEYKQDIQERQPEMILFVEMPAFFVAEIEQLGYTKKLHLDNKYDSLGVFIKNGSPAVTAELFDVFPYPIARIEKGQRIVYLIHPYPGIM
jgi:hypothetical protein